MKLKILFMVIVSVIVLSACGPTKMEKSITLFNQDKEEVAFPLEKPALFFFITTYT